MIFLHFPAILVLFSLDGAPSRDFPRFGVGIGLERATGEIAYRHAHPYIGGLFITTAHDTAVLGRAHSPVVHPELAQM